MPIHETPTVPDVCPRCGGEPPDHRYSYPSASDGLCDSCFKEYTSRSAGLVSLGWKYGAPFTDVDRWYHKVKEAFRDDPDFESRLRERPRIIVALRIFPYCEPNWSVELAVDANSDELARLNAGAWTRIPWKFDAHRYRFTEWDAVARIDLPDDSSDYYLVRFDRQEVHDDR